MHTYVHVETGLDVVFGNALVFELLCRSAMGVRYRLVLLRYPGSLC